LGDALEQHFKPRTDKFDLLLPGHHARVKMFVVMTSVFFPFPREQQINDTPVMINYDKDIFQKYVFQKGKKQLKQLQTIGE